MPKTTRAFACVAVLWACCASGFGADAAAPAAPSPAQLQPTATVTEKKAAQKTPAPQKARAPAKRRLDFSGRKRVGIASIYAARFAGRKMADGTRMNPQRHHAASRTLPLGTQARVTNLESGRSVVVTIRDRGPYVRGRIIDLTPASARRIGLRRAQGLAKVEVAPIAVPLPDGRIRRGEEARARRRQ